MTQRSASTRFDLPQPLGPTTPVSPGFDQEIGRLDERLEAEAGAVASVSWEVVPDSAVLALGRANASLPSRQGSARIAKKLAPAERVEEKVPHRRENELASVILQQEGDIAGLLTYGLCVSAPACVRPRGMAGAGAARTPGAQEKPLSALEIGSEFLFHFLDREGAGQALAVDEESRRGIDPELFRTPDCAPSRYLRATPDCPGRLRKPAGSSRPAWRSPTAAGAVSAPPKPVVGRTGSL